MKKIKSLTGLFLLIGILGFTVVVYPAFGAVERPSNLPDITIQKLLTNIINWGAFIVALVSILVILIAGIIWATSGGTEEGTKKARGMLLMGIVGLIIALAAWAIVNVVITVFFPGFNPTFFPGFSPTA